MSSPINGDDDGDDHLKYAPPWARQQAAQGGEAAKPSASPEAIAPPAASPPSAVASPDPAAPAASIAPPPPPAPAAPPSSSARSPDKALEEALQLLAEPPRAPPLHKAPAQPPAERHPRDLDLPASIEVADAPATAPRAFDQPSAWLRTPARPFEGDVAVRELRARMTLDPHMAPEPPRRPPSDLWVKQGARAAGVAALAAVAAYLVALFAFPQGSAPVPADRNGAPQAAFAAPKSDRVAGSPAVAAAPARLAVVESRRLGPNEAPPLGVALVGSLSGGAVEVSGLPADARLSRGGAGAAGVWRVPLAELAQAAIVPPRDFAGVMELSVELRAADGALLDRGAMRMAWAPALYGAQAAASGVASAQSLPRPQGAPSRPDALALDRDEIAMLVKRGLDFIANGDLASARLVLRRAAYADDPQAALLLGSTYDPATFSQLKVVGSAPDPAQARQWYQRAADLGSAEAARRLEPSAR